MEVAIIGVPDERWGETVKAVVSLKPDAEATEDELIAYCREHLAHYKCPTSVDIIDALPRNPTGKILKRDLRTALLGGPRPLDRLESRAARPDVTVLLTDVVTSGGLASSNPLLGQSLSADRFEVLVVHDPAASGFVREVVRSGLAARPAAPGPGARDPTR